MADLAQTANNVRSTSNTVIDLLQYGESVVAGNMVYLKASDSRYYKAKADVDDNSEEYKATAMVLQEAGVAEYGPAAIKGKVDIGATVAAADRIWLSGTTAGNVTKTDADLGSTWHPVLIGYVDASGLTDLQFLASDAEIP